MSHYLPAVREALPAYEVGDVIGQGAFGVVFAGAHRQLGRRVAIKLLPAALGSDPVTRDRFYQEARVASSLVHPHIVPVYDYVEHNGTCLIVMEHLGNGTLRSRFATEGLLPDQSCAVVLAMLSALHYAHENQCIHRDIKPENVLFGEGGAVKLGDFGIAKLLNAVGTNHTAMGEIIGTPSYLSPEQAGGLAVGRGTDVYSTGVLLYELLTGRLPYPTPEDPRARLYHHLHSTPIPMGEVAPHVPSMMVEVVATALRKHPDDRFADAHEFGVALARASAHAFGARWLRQSGLELLVSSDIAEAATEARRDPTQIDLKFRDTVVVSARHESERQRDTPSGLRAMNPDHYRSAAMAFEPVTTPPPPAWQVAPGPSSTPPTQAPTATQPDDASGTGSPAGTDPNGDLRTGASVTTVAVSSLRASLPGASSSGASSSGAHLPGVSTPGTALFGAANESVSRRRPSPALVVAAAVVTIAVLVLVLMILT